METNSNRSTRTEQIILSDLEKYEKFMGCKRPNRGILSGGSMDGEWCDPIARTRARSTKATTRKKNNYYGMLRTIERPRLLLGHLGRNEKPFCFQ